MRSLHSCAHFFHTFPLYIMLHATAKTGLKTGHRTSDGRSIERPPGFRVGHELAEAVQPRLLPLSGLVVAHTLPWPLADICIRTNIFYFFSISFIIAPTPAPVSATLNALLLQSPVTLLPTHAVTLSYGYTQGLAHSPTVRHVARLFILC